jgi:N6-adenosine-specific RNA methylase IME4
MKSNVEFPVILADPAWRYGTGSTARSSCEPHYATMTLSEILAMPVADLAAKDSLLFLWATAPLLPQAIEVVSAWGFEYVTVAFTWVKVHPSTGRPLFGMGYYTRGNAEYCLLGRRGRPAPLDRGVASTVLSPRGVHSSKPLEVYDRIERLAGKDAPKLELFARSRRAGWTQSGLEFNGCDYRTRELVVAPTSREGAGK